MKELEYMYDLQRFGWKLGLDVMEKLLEKLGNPQDLYASVHVGGTNGKGSVCCFVSSVLNESGYKVGLYTSPHIHRFNERIRIGDDQITDDEIISLVGEIREVVESEKLNPTFFEFTTALALLFFARKRVDIAIIEVGLGGTLDATNVLNPLVSCITNVGTDHVNYLGKTLIERFEKKSGIIKEAPVVSGISQPELIKELRVKCALRGVNLTLPKAGKILDVGESGQRVLLGKFAYPIKLRGEHQCMNLALAKGILDELISYGVNIVPRDVREGFWKAQWEGRLQTISKDPHIIVDGAHNIDGIEMLEKFLPTIKRKSVMIVALSDDKPLQMARICGYFDHVIVTEGSFKPMDCEKLSSVIPGSIAIKDTSLAVKKGLELLDGSMLICGSLYMIGSAINEANRLVSSK